MNDDHLQVTCGARHTAVLTDDGRVYCWGWDKHGAVTGASGHNVLLPRRLELPGRASCIAAGGWHTQTVVVAP